MMPSGVQVKVDVLLFRSAKSRRTFEIYNKQKGSMAAKHQYTTGSSNSKVTGEIDTSAPFQSVKDAVSLFGEGAFSWEKPSIKKPKPHSAEKVLVKETQLHLAQKELNKLKEKLKSAETTKVQALAELEKAKVTAEELSSKLKSLYESKESAIKANETAKHKAKQLEEANSGDPSAADGAWENGLETARTLYMTVVDELDAVKQELRKIHQDHEATSEAKVAAFNQAVDANDATRANANRAAELSKEISAVQESIALVKLAILQSQHEQAKIYSYKDVQKQSYKATLEESLRRLLALKQGFDPELPRNLEAQLSEKLNEIGALQKQMENAKASDLNSVKTVTSELNDAKESLQKVAEEESSLRSSVEALKMELENMKKEHSALKKTEAETESIAGNLHIKLRKSKAEFEACLAEESKAQGASDELITTLTQLSVETENAKRETEEMNTKAEELKKEARAARKVVKEAEEKLRVALEEAEEAKAAEETALHQIKVLSKQTNAVRASISESDAKITISREEFESLSRKVEESDLLAEMKVAAAMAQVEAVKASENEALKRLETTRKEIEDMKAETEEALKKAQMAEAAKKAVEGELRKWREREQKKAAEVASRILAESDSIESSALHYRVQRQSPPTKVIETRKLEKHESTLSRKVLASNLSGIFNRKKNQIEGGSPSYLPGEKLL